VRHWLAPSLAVATLLVVIMTACGGRTLNTSPADDDGFGGAGDGGSSGVGGMSGVGGSGAMSSGGGGAGGAGAGPSSSSSGGPVDCFACLGTNCPDAVAYCIQGMICAVTNCMSGGQPDLMCVFDCFDGDIGAALEAIGALTCVLQECQEECGGLLPFPGP